MIVHICDSSIQQPEAWEAQVQGQPRLHSKNPSRKTKVQIEQWGDEYDQTMLHVYTHEKPCNKSYLFAQLIAFVIVFYKSMYIFNLKKK